MKIAFVANTCWNIYNFRKGLVQHFLKRGDEVIVLAPEDEYTSRIEDWGVRCIHTPLEGTGSNPFSELGYIRKIHSTFKSEKPNVALSFTIKPNIYASLMGKLTGVRVICNVSGLGTVFLVKGLSGKIALALYKLAFRYCKHIFFQNEDDKDLFLSHISVKENKLSVLPGSGIDLDYFKPLPMPTGSTKKFLMISRVIVEKGVREYAEAASHFKDDENVIFSLIGKHDETHSRAIDRSVLDEWIDSGWIRYQPHSDHIPQLVKEHDAVVLPSYREGTSRTLLEGAALGRPLITTDVPGCKEVVKDGYNGFLCQPKSGKSLADKIRLFLSMNEAERDQMASNSRILVENTYDERIVIDIYDRTIHRIIH